MAEAALQMQPETVEVETRALSLPEKARELEIRDQASLDRAGEFLIGVKSLRKEIDDTFDPLVKKAHEAHKAAVAAKKKVEAPVAEAETIVKRAIGAYHDEQARIARAAAELAERERVQREKEQRERDEAERKRLEAATEERRLQDAVAAEQRGDVETAERILEAPPEPVAVAPAAPVFAPPPPTAPRAPKGVSLSERWEFEIVDEAQIPRKFLVVDRQKIAGVVRALKGEAEIPGVRVYRTTGVSARSR